MMKRLPILLLLVMFGSGCQDNSREQAAKETKAKPLTPIPDEVTLKFVRELWNQPHDETGVIDQVKQYMRPGKWRILRKFAPNGGTPSTNELSREVKYVDRRFLVFQQRFEKLIDEGAVSLEGSEAMGVITYDFEEKVLKYWEFTIGEENEGSLELYMTGEPDIKFQNIAWKSHKMPNHPPGWRMEFIQDIDDAREKLVAEGRMINGEETMGLIQDEMVLCEVDRATRDGILIMGNNSEPKGLDPHIVTAVIEFNIISALFEGLVVAHPSKDGVALPGMAEKWYPTDPQKPDEWVFELRKDAKWSDGTPLTAEDFLFAFERILTPELGSEYPFMLYYIIGAEDFHKGKTTDFSTVQVSAPDPHTLRVKLNSPIAFLPEIAEHYTWFPVPKHSILKHGRIGDRVTDWTKPGNIVSNGAFILTSWKFNDHIQVERHPLYWDKDNVGINGIRYLPISNFSTENRMYFDGQMHITYALAPELIDYARERYPDQVRNELYLGTYFIRANVTREPFTDPRVRMAFSKAIDQQSMITNVLKGGQKPAGGLVPPFGDYRPAKTIGFDPEGACKLLAEAGYPGGEGMPEIEFLTTDKETSKANAEALQAMWKDNLGVSIKIKQMEWTSYITTMFEKDYGLAAGGWIGDYADPLTFLDMWMKDGGNNRTGWHNEQFEALLKKAGNTGDPQARYRVLEEAEAIFLSETPILPLYWYARNYLIHPDVKGWDPLILDNHPYKFLRLERNPNLSPPENSR